MSRWVIHSECPDMDNLVSQCNGDCDACYYKDHDDLGGVIEELKRSSEVMSTKKSPHKYYKAVSLNKVLELLGGM